MSREDDSRAGMGTTLTAVHVGESDIAIAHVGDSRAYRFRDGRAEPPHRGPLARRGDAPPRAAHRRGGRRAPAALDHHPRARTRARRPRRHPLVGRPRRRRHPALQRRADVDDLRGPGRGDPARGRPGSSRRAARSSPPPTAPAGATTSPSSCCASRRSVVAPRRRATTISPPRCTTCPRRTARARRPRSRRARRSPRRPRPPRRRPQAPAAPRAQGRRPGEAPAPRPPGARRARGDPDRARPGRDRRVPRLAGRLLHRHHAGRVRRDVPRAAVRPARRHRPLQHQLHLRASRWTRSRRRAARRCSTTSCARTTTRPTSCASSSRAA